MRLLRDFVLSWYLVLYTSKKQCMTMMKSYKLISDGFAHKKDT